MSDPANTEQQDRLPVTQEVGSEGGSFADSTVQKATLSGDVRRVDRPLPHGGSSSGGTSSNSQDPDDGVHFSKPPDSTAPSSAPPRHERGDGAGRRGERPGVRVACVP